MSAVEEVRAVLVGKFGVDPSAIAPEVPLRRLRLDSLALEELRIVIENRLDIDLEDVELSSRSTVGDLVTVVHVKLPA